LLPCDSAPERLPTEVCFARLGNHEAVEDVTQGRVVGHAAEPARLDRFDGDGTPIEIDIRFAVGPTAAAAARAALSALERSVDPVRLDDLRLLVSELVTNSVRHAQTKDVRLHVTVAGDMVRVEVSDAGRGFSPAPQAPGVERAGGWGLYLVDRLTDRWGVAREGLTRVWFEMDARAPGGGGAIAFATA
jgi:anti-sigma regulatory factor (Ser/Thr protein kinase)